MAKAKGSDLTDKQVLFCKEYLKTLNATQSAILAGYSEKTATIIGFENLTKPNIQSYIQELMNVRADKLAIDAQWVLQRFKDVSDRCMTAVPVMISDGEGGLVESGEYKFDSSGANKATEMIAKHIGFFEKDNEQSKSFINPIIQLNK